MTTRKSCGSSAGYVAHRKAKETACEPCRVAQAAYDKAYNEAHRERIRERRREYRERNRERIAAKKKADYEANREAAQAKNRAYHQANREAIRAQKREAHIKNREANCARAQAWLLANPDRARDRARLWRQANPEKKGQYSRARRARAKNNACVPYTTQEVLALYGTDCHICGLAIDLTAPRLSGQPGWQKGLHVDHVIPIVAGGADSLDNVRPAHGVCNVKKGGRQVVIGGQNLTSSDPVRPRPDEQQKHQSTPSRVCLSKTDEDGVVIEAMK